MLYMVAKHFIKHLRGTKVNREEHYVPISLLWLFHRQPASSHQWNTRGSSKLRLALPLDWREGKEIGGGQLVCHSGKCA